MVLRPRDTGHGVQAAGRHGAWGSGGGALTRCMEFGPRDTGHGVQGTGPWARGIGFKAWGTDTGLGVQGVGHGHGARGSGRGTQGSGLNTDGWPDLFLDEFPLCSAANSCFSHNIVF